MAIISVDLIDAPLGVIAVIAVREFADIAFVFAYFIAATGAIPSPIILAAIIVDDPARICGVGRTRIGAQKISIAADRVEAPRAHPCAFIGIPEIRQAVARFFSIRAARPCIEKAFVTLDTIDTRRFRPRRTFFGSQTRRGQHSPALVGLTRIRAPAIGAQIIIVRSFAVDLPRPAPSFALKHREFSYALTRRLRMRPAAIDIEKGLIRLGTILRGGSVPSLVFQILRRHRRCARGQQGRHRSSRPHFQTPKLRRHAHFPVSHR